MLDLIKVVFTLDVCTTIEVSIHYYLLVKKESSDQILREFHDIDLIIHHRLVGFKIYQEILFYIYCFRA